MTTLENNNITKYIRLENMLFDWLNQYFGNIDEHLYVSDDDIDIKPQIEYEMEKKEELLKIFNRIIKK